MPMTRDERLAKMRERARAWQAANPERHKQNQRLYAQRNKEAIKIRAATNAKTPKNKEANRLRLEAWRVKFPWYDSWQCARQRCINPENPRFKNYGGRGIRFDLTKADTAFLWVRDRAGELQIPSLDRLNNDGPYDMDNCRFIELSDNCRKRAMDYWKKKLGYNPSAFRSFQLS